MTTNMLARVMERLKDDLVARRKAEDRDYVEYKARLITETERRKHVETLLVMWNREDVSRNAVLTRLERVLGAERFAAAVAMRCGAAST